MGYMDVFRVAEVDSSIEIGKSKWRIYYNERIWEKLKNSIEMGYNWGFSETLHLNITLKL